MNQLNLSQLIDDYLPQKYKAASNKLFKHVYDVVSLTYSGSSLQHQIVIDGINTLAYIILKGDDVPIYWDDCRPFDNLPDVDYDELKSVLKEYMLTVDSICWDIDTNYGVSTTSSTYVEPIKHSTVVVNSNQVMNGLLSNHAKQRNEIYEQKLQVQTSHQIDETTISKLTPLEDVLLDPGYPCFPKLDFSDYWIVAIDAKGEEYGIPKSLPLVPECQSDITVTTDVSRMTKTDFLKLYPNHIMKLRNSCMYQKYDGYDLDYDEDLGVIFPIAGFSKAQVIDNIIKYPDLTNIGPGRVGKKRISKFTEQKETIWEDFYKRIELNGELHLITKDFWEQTSELSCLPPNKAFQQEYVIRKYLLERDNGIHHEKEMFGTLYPFITLFMPMEEYIKRGYNNVESIAEKCVKSRVSYFRSRNPMLLRLGLHYNYDGELINE